MTRTRALQIAFGVLALAYVVAHVAALYTDAANWDEFALLRRAQDSLQTGVLQSGGRPGLAVLPLMPFVDDCTHVMDVVHATRIAWAFITFALLGGVFVLLRIATRRTSTSFYAAAIGTASLALLPLFLRWSLQVRTDQPAVAAALWAGVALFASQKRWWLAAVGGALAATGYLCSQKAVYIVALVGVLLAGDWYIGRDFDWRREAKRVAAAVAGGIVTLLVYRVVVQAMFVPPDTVSLDEGMNRFRWYKMILHYRLYRDIVPTAIPHVALIGLVFAAALHAFRRSTTERRPLLVALVVGLLGIAVGRFHTASFPYFWITIGVFPATTIALGYAGIRELLPRAHLAVIALAWLLMIVLAVRYRAETLADTQAVQRDSFGFVERLPASMRGFNTDGGLICRRDPDPLPVFLGQHVQARFFGKNGPAYAEKFVAEHRTRPVAFIVRSNRVGFPGPVKTFWETHYVLYRAAVWLAGQPIAGARDTRLDLDLVMNGRYRWQAGDGRITVDGTPLAPGDTIELTAGAHAVTIASDRADGMLVLAVDEPPGPIAPFYDKLPMLELSGVRRSWW